MLVFPRLLVGVAFVCTFLLDGMVVLLSPPEPKTDGGDLYIDFPSTSMVKMLKVKDETYAELIDIGKYSETMDDIIRKCLEAYKEKKGLKSRK